MIDQSKVGTDWQADELDAIVAAYFAMLEGLPTARRGFKADSKRALDARIGRGIGSIDFKLGNLAYIAGELGLTRLPGFAPASNAQKDGIYSAFERYLDAHPDAWDIGLPFAGDARPGLSEAAAPYSSPFHGEGDHGVVEGPTPRSPLMPPQGPILLRTAPPPLGPARPPRPEGLARIVRKYDPAARDHRNRALGLLGEEHVLRHEHAYLRAHDRPDLARKIEWTSQERGDGAGYDIRSFDPTGKERLIEVKATRGGPATDFFLTRTEREVAAERPDAWRLYRLHDLAAAPGLFQLKPPLEAAVTLTAETWRVGF